MSTFLFSGGEVKLYTIWAAWRDAILLISNLENFMLRLLFFKKNHNVGITASVLLYSKVFCTVLLKNFIKTVFMRLFCAWAINVTFSHIAQWSSKTR